MPSGPIAAATAVGELGQGSVRRARRRASGRERRWSAASARWISTIAARTAAEGASGRSGSGTSPTHGASRCPRRSASPRPARSATTVGTVAGNRSASSRVSDRLRVEGRKDGLEEEVRPVRRRAEQRRDPAQVERPRLARQRPSGVGRRDPHPGRRRARTSRGRAQRGRSAGGGAPVRSSSSSSAPAAGSRRQVVERVAGSARTRARPGGVQPSGAGSVSDERRDRLARRPRLPPRVGLEHWRAEAARRPAGTPVAATTAASSLGRPRPGALGQHAVRARAGSSRPSDRGRGTSRSSFTGESLLFAPCSGSAARRSRSPSRSSAR